MIECKHHVKPWIRTDIQTALYVCARFIDVKNRYTAPMLVTNTRFSKQVTQYSKGIGLRLMGWRFPTEDSLEYNIEKYKLYPVTMLSYLNEKIISKLLRLNILLVRDFCSMDIKQLSKILKLSKLKANNILEGSKKVCK